MNLNEFIGRTTSVDVEDTSYRLLELSDPEIFEYPFAYVSEPGEMELTEAEVVNLREYVDRGGFILIDDFDTWHMDNLREEMLRVFPERVFERLSVDNPIFDLVYTLERSREHGAVHAGRDANLLRPCERRWPHRGRRVPQQRSRELLGVVRQPAVSAAAIDRRFPHGHELRRAFDDTLILIGGSI